jgi:hypothetical protein
MDVSNWPKVSHKGLRRLFLNSVRTRRPLIALGAPGIGKTQVFRALARFVARKLVTLDLGNRAREDVMLPVKVVLPDGTTAVVTVPLDSIMVACREGVVLQIDEATRCDRNKQAVAMMLANERELGSYKLHPDTVVVLTGNSTESSGTYALNDALVNRCCCVVVQPDRDEVREVLTRLSRLNSDALEDGEFVPCVIGSPAHNEKVDVLGAKISAYAGMRTELLQLEPPDGAQDSCAQWPSPRALHHAIDRMAASMLAGEALDDVGLAEIGGCIGREAAAALFAVLANESKLPTVDEVVNNPKTAKLPPDTESAIAGLGLVALAHKRDVNATWLYVGRFTEQHPEIQSVIARDLLSKVPTTPEALTVFNKIVGKINRVAMVSGAR